jgi:hypothetical protein
MAPEHSIIFAITKILQKLPNTNIQFVKTKTNEFHQFCHVLANEAKELSTPNTLIIKTEHQLLELIINHRKISSEYSEEIRKAHAQPRLNDYLKKI